MSFRVQKPKHWLRTTGPKPKLLWALIPSSEGRFSGGPYVERRRRLLDYSYKMMYEVKEARGFHGILGRGLLGTTWKKTARVGIGPC